MKIKVQKAPSLKKEQQILNNSFCLNTSIAILKCAGVWMPDLRYPWNLCYKIFAFILQFILFFCIVLAEISYVFVVMGDTNRAIEAAVLLLSHLVQGVKVLTIVLRQGAIKQLITFMDGPDFTPKDAEKQVLVTRETKKAALVGQAIIGSASVTAIFWCIVPVLKTGATLPLKTAFPFDWTENPIFGIMYAYTAVSVIVVGVSDAAENYLVSGLMVMGAIQLDVLSLALREIGRNGQNEYKETVRCIKHHQNIIKYVDELAGIFGFAILCQFIASSLIVCMSLFKITITTEPMEFVTLTFYLSCVFMELLMYCYPGDLLINKSLLVSEAAYPNDWSGDLRSRKALLLTALRAQRALVVNAGGVFKVSLPTAAAVVRTAYSYYAVLSQKMNEKEDGKI